MRNGKKIIACMVALAVLMVVQSAAARGKLEGVWKVTQITFTGPNARTVNPIEPGIWIFTKKHASYVSVYSDTPRLPLPPNDATDAQKAAAWTPFNAAASTYEVKGSTVTFHTIVTKRLTKPGELITSDFKIDGNTLSITPKAYEAGPYANPITFKLVRLE